MAFSVNGDELLVNQSGVLDYEDQASITILVETTDDGTPPLSTTVNMAFCIFPLWA